MDSGDVEMLLSARFTLAPYRTSSLTIATCPRKQAIAIGSPGWPWLPSISTGTPAFSRARTLSSSPLRILLIRSSEELTESAPKNTISANSINPIAVSQADYDARMSAVYLPGNPFLPCLPALAKGVRPLHHKICRFLIAVQNAHWVNQPAQST